MKSQKTETPEQAAARRAYFARMKKEKAMSSPPGEHWSDTRQEYEPNAFWVRQYFDGLKERKECPTERPSCWEEGQRRANIQRRSRAIRIEGKEEREAAARSVEQTA